MNILVTGGYGFIGSALIRYLLDETSHNILNVDSLTYASDLNSIPNIENSRYKHLELDITNFDKLKDAFLSFQPDMVMHLAAESHVDNSILAPEKFILTNVFGTFNLLQITKMYLSQFKEDFLFHHISTDEVFGDLDLESTPFNESTRYDPSSPYSASKASSDHLVRAWGRTYGIPYLITNCSNNYGPYQNNEKLIPKTITRALNLETIPIYGNGSQIRDWLYVDDHVQALYRICTSNKKNESFMIGGNNEKTNLEVVKIICTVLDKIRPIDSKSNLKSYSNLITFVPDRPGHDKRYAVDISKIFKNIGWSPNESFESGIQKTIEWYLENRL